MHCVIYQVISFYLLHTLGSGDALHHCNALETWRSLLVMWFWSKFFICWKAIMQLS